MSKAITLQKTVSLLEDADRLVIVTHVNPDGDAIGSALALAEALRVKGKMVIVTIDDEISSFYKFIPGIDTFVRFSADEQVEADLLVVMDASSLDRIGKVVNCVRAPILNIDHHVSNTGYADYLYLDVMACATGEIVYELLRELSVTISKDMAFCLYVAIVTDCGYFKYSNTTPKCLNYAAELLSIGVQPDVVSDFLEMKSRNDVNLLSKVLETLDFHHNGRIASIMISLENYDADIATDSFIHYPRYIEGVEVAVMFKAVDAEVTRVSMRSRLLDVSRVALSYGGGGHKRAAGFTLQVELAVAKEQTLKRLTEEMDLL